MLSSLELAKLCKVSQGTVDRALHDRPGISRKTKQRIMDAAKKHGYAPNPAAHEMIRGQASVIGAITPSFSSLFFSDLFEALQMEVQPAGLKLMVVAVPTPEEFLATLREFAARRCRAAVVIPPADDLEIPEQFTGRMPVISFASPIRGANTYFLSPDEKHTGEQAVDYLYARGHRKIAHVTYTRDAQGIRHRSEGYQRRMKQLALEPCVLAAAPDAEMIRALQARGITAVFAHNDWLAADLWRAAQRAGLRVPHDLSILGVDDSPTFTRIFPDLTTLHYPFAALAQRACALIASEPDRNEPAFNLNIVERASVQSIAPRDH